MGAVFMLMLKNPDAMAKEGALSAKAQLMGMVASWDAYATILTQAIGVGGILLFGFVASWLFGREYSEGTAKDLLALPTSRTRILNAKFCLYLLWCCALALSNLLLGGLISLLLDLPAPTGSGLHAQLWVYGVTSLLTLLLGTPLAVFALWGKSYLAPLGVVALTLVFSQVIASAGWGYYFPWAVPGLYSGAGGEYKAQLDIWSYLILLLMSGAGYLATVTYWKRADQSK
ncbi:hypothetical protein ADICEAN_01805 [Cesiribacter andamanensis AMV16]|uniref:ABC-type transport system involved in multi-copper enzyme maturation, permease component n=1 Tax=Cesiribacter andamanensis AMV16 TaxID=1279009 RepID=M7N760_9BACT|nr:hypothetical protein ADICEAN_01805 [Cesiribacter andamanensis AMV16]